MNSLIKKYIEKLTITDIDNFARKNNIILDNNELDFLYNIIKNDYKKLLKSDYEDIFSKLKKNLSDENYQKTVDLYFKYKNIYGYLL